MVVLYEKGLGGSRSRLRSHLRAIAADMRRRLLLGDVGAGRLVRTERYGAFLQASYKIDGLK